MYDAREKFCPPSRATDRDLDRVERMTLDEYLGLFAPVAVFRAGAYEVAIPAAHAPNGVAFTHRGQPGQSLLGVCADAHAIILARALRAPEAA